MSFGTKYRTEFTDTLGMDWRIDIQVNPDPNAITTLQSAGLPLRIEWYGEDNIFDMNIMGSKAEFTVVTDTDFALDDLFTSNYLQYKTIIYYNSTVFWSGYITVNSHSEPYDHTPYEITLSATDGLGLLKEFKFKDLNLTARTKVSVVIHDILDKVGITAFTEYVNLYESTMSSDTDDSPFDQCGIDPYLFESEDCYTALSEILKTFSAGIKQDKGEFVIYRFTESKNATMYGRTFTDGTTKSATTKTPVQYIDRPAQSSNFCDYEGGVKTGIPQLKNFYANHDFGFKGSLLESSDFKFEDFTSGGAAIRGWDTLVCDIQPAASILVDGSKYGVFLADVNVSPSIDHFINQTVTIYTTTDPFSMTFEVGGFSGVGTTGNIYAMVKNIGPTAPEVKYFTGSTWSLTETTFTVATGTFPSTSNIDYKTVNFTVTGIPYTGLLAVNLYAASSAGTLYCIYKSAKLIFTSLGVPPEGIAYTIGNGIEGQTMEQEYIVGDGYGFVNDYQQYRGALNVWDISDAVKSTSKSWHTRGNTENIPIIRLVAEEIGAQFLRAKQLIDITIYENHYDEFFSLTGNLQDVLNTYSSNNRIFAVSSGSFNVKDREWDLVLHELL